MRLYFLMEQSNNESSGLKFVGTLNLKFFYLLEALKHECRVCPSDTGSDISICHLVVT